MFDVLIVGVEAVLPTLPPSFAVPETAVHFKQEAIDHMLWWDGLLLVMAEGVIWQAERGITSSSRLLVPVSPLGELKVLRKPLALSPSPFASPWWENRQFYFIACLIYLEILSKMG